MPYNANDSRYKTMQYRRCGRSGVKLPLISLGLWNNFGYHDSYENQRKMLLTAFDSGITHIDIANNYGPPAGAAEECFGKCLKGDLRPYRDELIVSSKAGYWMWNGPYGEWGSRKYLVASCDQSLKRTGLEYFDIFYSHRFDPETPLEETMGALDYIVRSGRALYAGISSYSPEQTKKASEILKKLGTPCLIHQPSYSILNRWIEHGLQDVLDAEGIGSIAFCPLDQGLLTSKYLSGSVPSDSRAGKTIGTLGSDRVTPELVAKLNKLNAIAQERGQSLAQMALAWVLRGGKVTSALIGASRPEQIIENVKTLDKLDFSSEELKAIDAVVK